MVQHCLFPPRCINGYQRHTAVCVWGRGRGKGEGEGEGEMEGEGEG